jgi:hypothetical protein
MYVSEYGIKLKTKELFLIGFLWLSPGVNVAITIFGDFHFFTKNSYFLEMHLYDNLKLWSLKNSPPGLLGDDLGDGVGVQQVER